MGEASKEAVPTLRKVGNPTVRDSYLQLLARRSTVDERVLLEALHAPPRADAGRLGGGRTAESEHGGVRLTLEAVRAAREEVSPEEVLRAVTPVEAELLRLILLVPDQQPRVAESLDASHLALPSTVARELYRSIPEVRGLSGEAGVHADPVPFDRGHSRSRLSKTRETHSSSPAAAGPTYSLPLWKVSQRSRMSGRDRSNLPVNCGTDSVPSLQPTQFCVQLSCWRA